MTEISAAMVKELRERSGAGIMDCKEALKECDADMDKASVLRELPIFNNTSPRCVLTVLERPSSRNVFACSVWYVILVGV